MVKEQRHHMKKVNAKKVNPAKTQADRSCKNLLINSVEVSTHRFRLLDINVTKNVHSTLQQIDLARNSKKWKEQVYT
jgi:hypothetical protein